MSEANKPRHPAFRKATDAHPLPPNSVVERQAKEIAQRIGVERRELTDADFRIRPDEPEALGDPVVDANAYYMANRVEILTWPGVVAINHLPDMLPDLDALPFADRWHAVNACCMHYPRVVLQHIHLLDLDASQVTLLCKCLRVTHAELYTFLSSRQPLALASRSGVHIIADKDVREAVTAWYAERDPYSLFEYMEHMDDLPAELAQEFSLLEPRIGSWVRFHEKLIDPKQGKSDVSLRKLTPLQREGMAQAQRVIRHLFESAHGQGDGTLRTSLREFAGGAAGTLASVVGSTGRPPDREALLAALDRVVQAYGIPPDVAREYEEAVFRMLENHRATRTYIARCQGDPRQVFLGFTGRQPAGEVECAQTPFALLLRCKDPRDFTVLFARTPPDQEPSEKDVEGAARAGGFAQSRREAGFGTVNVIVEKVREGGDARRSAGIYKHEEMHAYMDMYTLPGMHLKHHDPERYAQHEERGARVSSGIRSAASVHALLFAKQELLCYLLEGVHPADVRTLLLQGADQGGAYDYSAQFRRWIDPKGLLLRGRLKRMFTDHMEAVHRAGVERGLATLERFKDAGWGMDLAAELLVSEPLETWPQLADKMLAEPPRQFPTELPGALHEHEDTMAA